MTAKQASLGLDAERSAKRALYAKTPDAQIAPAVTFKRSGTKAFVASVAAKARKAPVNATGSVGLRKVTITGSKPGYALDETAARKTVDDALANPSASRKLKQAVTPVKAAVSYADARRRYSTVVTVEKSTFTLRLFKDLKVVKTYEVAVGQPAYPTPSGQWTIANKQVNPTWSVPNSPWAGELQGTTVEGGSAANPLKARWMGIVNGVGIHGTGEDGSIGSRASHGCIRMHVPDVIALYKRVPVGTPVRIG
jgi:lipoprotein-anchoring transpeptidase ErfK/SrfK